MQKVTKVVSFFKMAEKQKISQVYPVSYRSDPEVIKFQLSMRYSLLISVKMPTMHCNLGRVAAREREVTVVERLNI